MVSNVTNYTAGSTNTDAFLDEGLDLVEGARFLITTVDTDLGDIDTLYYEVTTIDWDTPDVLVELEDLIGTRDVTFDDLTDTPDVGDITFALEQVNDTHVYLTFSGATISYNTAVSENGVKVTLPANDFDDTEDVGTGVALTFTEADKDDDVGEGMPFTVTVKSTSNGKLHASTTNVSTYKDGVVS